MKKITAFILFLMIFVRGNAFDIFPFTFESKGFSINNLWIAKAPDHLGEEYTFAEVTLNNKIGEFISISKYWAMSKCPRIKTLDDFLNYSEKYKDINPACKEWMSERLEESKEYNYNELKIFVFQIPEPFDLPNNETTIDDNFSFIHNEILVFDNNKHIGFLEYIHQKDKEKEFESWLKTIKINKNLKSEDFYIKNAKKSLEFGNYQSALENVIGLLFVNAKNPEIKELLKEIYEGQKWNADFGIDQLNKLD